MKTVVAQGKGSFNRKFMRTCLYLAFLLSDVDGKSLSVKLA